MSKKILVLNGPNLNMLGIREPEIYGTKTLSDLEAFCYAEGKKQSLQIDFRQSNFEGELIGWIHEALNKFDGILINPAGLGHTSVALLDALSCVDIPKVEVHLTNIHKRDSFRQNSFTAKSCNGVICGFGINSYKLGLSALKEIIG